jgi:putative FmdB family regulatory protein
MVYEYKCRECGHEFSLDKRIGEANSSELCPECGGPGYRVYSAVSFQFKGAGASCALDGGCAGCKRGGHGAG